MYTRKRMRSAKVQEDAGILPSASYARESLSRSACAGCPVARARSPGRQQRRRGVRGQVFTNQPVGGREGGRGGRRRWPWRLSCGRSPSQSKSSTTNGQRWSGSRCERSRRTWNKVRLTLLFLGQDSPISEGSRDPEEKGGVFTLYPGFACSETGGILGVLFFKIPGLSPTGCDLDSTVFQDTPVYKPGYLGKQYCQDHPCWWHPGEDAVLQTGTKPAKPGYNG